ncbi:MAG: hypothetical protein ABFD60_07980 [Bryobacteraceae bacterium]
MSGDTDGGFGGLKEAEMRFGFTNDESVLQKAEAWKSAAIADGWSHKPTYNHEDESSACTLEKNGFHAIILTRTCFGSAKWKFEATVSVWGPDGLVINLGETYDFEALKAGLRICLNCGAKNVDTRRVSFAGRVCNACYPEQKKKHEYPGWDN